MMHQTWEKDSCTYTSNWASELVIKSIFCIRSCLTACDKVKKCGSCHDYDFGWKVAWGDQ